MVKKSTLIRIAIIAALLTQITHAAYVFKIMCKPTQPIVDEILPYIFAISLELSIYIFTLSGKRNVATWFAIVSFLINILYYWKPIGFTLEFCAMIIISGVIPVTIWFYSDLLKGDIRRTELKKRPVPIQQPNII